MSVFRRMVVTIMILLAAATAQAATQQQLDSARARGLAWLISLQQADGSWTTGAGLEIQATSQVIGAMSNAGIKSGYLGASVASASPAGQTTVDKTDLTASGPASTVKITETKNFPAGRHYGVLAQAMEKVLPEVVKTDDNGDKAVAYSGIIPVLIEAIKEQQAQIELLKKQVANLQK